MFCFPWNTFFSGLLLFCVYIEFISREFANVITRADSVIFISLGYIIILLFLKIKSVKPTLHTKKNIL